MTKIKLI